MYTNKSIFKKLFLKINKFLTNETIVTDVGSTKELSTKNVKKQLKRNITWIPSHPIAGSEVSGAKHGDKNLFKKKWCILIKEKNIKKKHLSQLKSFWKKLGAKVYYDESEKNMIWFFSITSHLPHLIAYNLVKTATDFEKEKKI